MIFFLLIILIAIPACVVAIVLLIKQVETKKRMDVLYKSGKISASDYSYLMQKQPPSSLYGETVPPPIHTLQTTSYPQRSTVSAAHTAPFVPVQTYAPASVPPYAQQQQQQQQQQWTLPQQQLPTVSAQQTSTQYNAPTIPPAMASPVLPPASPPITAIPSMYGHPPAVSTPPVPPKAFNAVNLVMGLGVTFILLAGFIFATTTWQILPSSLRLILLAALTAIFFAASTLAEKKFKLRNTGIAFYTLGSFFSFVSLIAAGYFTLFGNWFSLFGAGKYTLFACGFAFVAAFSAWGVHKYKSALFFWVTISAAETSVILLFLQFLQKTQWLPFSMTIFSCGLLAIWNLTPKPLIPAKFTASGKSFSVWNFFILSSFSFFHAFLFYSGSAGEMLLLLCFAVFTALLSNKRKYQFAWHLHPFIVARLLYNIAQISMPTTSSRAILCFILFVSSFWAYRLIHYKKQTGWTLTADIVFAGSIALGSIGALLFGMPLAALTGFVCLLGSFIVLAFSPQARFSAVAAAYLLPYTFYLFIAALLSTTSLQNVETWVQVLLIFGAQVFYLIASMLLSITPNLLHRSRFETPFASGALAGIMLSFLVPTFLDHWLSSYVPVVAFALLTVYGLIRLGLIRRYNTGIAKIGNGRFLFVATYSSGILSYFFVFVYILANLFTLTEQTLLFSIAPIALCFVSIRRFYSKHPEGPISRLFWLFSVSLAQLLLLGTFATSYLGGQVVTLPYSIYRLIAIFLIFAILYLRKQDIGGLLLPFAFYYALVQFFVGMNKAPVTSTILFASALLFFLYAIAGRLLYPRILNTHNGWPRVDFFTFTALLTPIFWFQSDTSFSLFGTFTFLAIWPLLFIGRATFANNKSWLQSIATLFALQALYLQPFLLWPQEYKIEIWLGLFFLYFLSLRFLIWSKTHAKQANWCLLASYIFVFAGLCLNVFIHPTTSKAILLAVWSVGLITLPLLLRPKESPIQKSLQSKITMTAIFTSQIAPALLIYISTHSSTAFSGSALHSLPLSLVWIALWGIAFVYFYKQKLDFTTMFFPLGIYYVAFQSANLLQHPQNPNLVYWLFAILFFVFAVKGRILYKQLYTPSKSGPQIDYFSIFNGATALFWLSHPDPTYSFGGILFVAVWFLQFRNRTRLPFANQTIITASTIALYAAFLFQPFIELPSVYVLEIRSVLLILFICLLKQSVWKGIPHYMCWVVFGATLLCILLQTRDALLDNHLFDSLFLSIAALGILLYASFVRLRRWFLLSIVVLTGMLFYKTAPFWTSLAWWIYLLVAGILLISLAIANEGYRQKGSSLGKKILTMQFFSQWKW